MQKGRILQAAQSGKSKGFQLFQRSPNLVWVGAACLVDHDQQVPRLAKVALQIGLAIDVLLEDEDVESGQYGTA